MFTLTFVVFAIRTRKYIAQKSSGNLLSFSLVRKRYLQAILNAMPILKTSINKTLISKNASVKILLKLHST